MAGVGTPGVILPPGASPHGYALRPSDARLLGDADIVVWVGPALTPWLADPIDALAAGARRVTLQDAPGVQTLPVRSGGPFEADEHDHETGSHGHDEHGHDLSVDGHLWLDPDNAIAAARAIAAALSEADPANAAAYAANAEAFAAETETQKRHIAERLAPLRNRPFLVFHDAYQYFEHRFDFPAAASIVLQDGVAPGAGRVAETRARVRDAGIVCAFSESEFEPGLLTTVTEGSAARTGTLDGLGVGIPPGPGLYPALLDRLVDSFEMCLAD
jgi:zinc transport system substrate-binding protein